jgi:hypothetical protein
MHPSCYIIFCCTRIFFLWFYSYLNSTFYYFLGRGRLSWTSMRGRGFKSWKISLKNSAHDGRRCLAEKISKKVWNMVFEPESQGPNLYLQIFSSAYNFIAYSSIFAGATWLYKCKKLNVTPLLFLWYTSLRLIILCDIQILDAFS